MARSFRTCRSCCFLFLVLTVALTACQREMLSPPYIMRGEPGRQVFAKIDPAFQTPDIPIMYITDRAVDKTTPQGPQYGFKRCRTVEYGAVTISPTPQPTWEQFVNECTRDRERMPYSLHIKSIERLGQIQEVLARAVVTDGQLVFKPGAMDELKQERADLRQAMARWLDHSTVKDAYVYVHGFNNTFDDAAFRLAEAWHYSGRPGIPIMFTWPAGHGGLKGYAYDRESGEFAVVHLKLLLLALAENPAIERVHLIGHSRGTDVATSALRELHLEIRAATGRGAIGILSDNPLLTLTPEQMESAPSTAKYLKMATLVLAAPDLDAEVFSQRFSSENLFRAADRIVVYFSHRDSALAWAQWLFSGGGGRIGDLKISDFSPRQLEFLSSMNSVEMIDCDTTGFSSHAYIFQHPSALSDLILAIRQSRSPGAANGRPLEQPMPGIWKLTNDYLKPKKTN